jgi:histidinol-phosphate aminotransferase
MQQAAPEMWQYCDPENHGLKQALAAWHGVSPDNICIGEGIDGLFGTTARLFVNPGDKVATSAGAYPTFNYQVAGAGGEIVTVPYVNDREDPASLLDLARREGARMIYLANPDNPMGTWWRAAELQAMIEDLPEGVVLCLDEAYGEFAPAGTLPDLDPHNPQVLRFRTFSKAYGLAGLRVGYVIGEAQIIKAYDKIRNTSASTAWPRWLQKQRWPTRTGSIPWWSGCTQHATRLSALRTKITWTCCHLPPTSWQLTVVRMGRLPRR